MTITVKGVYTQPAQIDVTAVRAYLEMRDLPPATAVAFACESIPNQNSPGRSVSLLTVKLVGLDGSDPDLRAFILDDCGESFLLNSVTGSGSELISYTAT